MQQLEQGQRLKLATLLPPTSAQMSTFSIEFEQTGSNLTLDLACFGQNEQGKLAHDDYMTFFNQPQTPCGAVKFSDGKKFSFDLARLPAHISKLTLTAALDGVGNLGALGKCFLRLLDQQQTLAQFAFSGQDLRAERTLLLLDIYKHQGEWRISPVAQGFDGGLDALVVHFGAELADAPAPAPAASAPPNKLSLEKKIAEQAPQLVSLVKQAGVSLQKVGLDSHRAKVCLCLDISGSMRALYSQGKVQALAERVLALACKFDDDGEIDVFLFGAKAHQTAPMNLENCKNYIQQLSERHPLESDTRYGLAMEAIRKHYFGSAPVDLKNSQVKAAQLPVYVMFVTDGSTSDGSFTEKQMRAASYEAIFWKFMGIGRGRKSKAKKFAAFADSDFPFLEKLDDLSGRLIDNADYFAVQAPDEYPDAQLYDMMMEEYPQWLKEARSKGVLA